MKISWRIKILLWWYALFRPKAKNENLIKIGKAGEGVNSILFLLPSEKKHAQIASHFVKRDRKTDSLKIKYVVHKDGLEYYIRDLKSHIIYYTDNDLNWLGALASIPIIDRINSVQYDALVDLNQSVDQTLSLLCLELDIPVKVGFQSPLSDRLYSMVIEPSQTGFLEKNYETIEKVLGLE